MKDISKLLEQANNSLNLQERWYVNFYGEFEKLAKDQGRIEKISKRLAVNIKNIQSLLSKIYSPDIADKRKDSYIQAIGNFILSENDNPDFFDEQNKLISAQTRGARIIKNKTVIEELKNAWNQLKISERTREKYQDKFDELIKPDQEESVFEREEPHGPWKFIENVKKINSLKNKWKKIKSNVSLLDTDEFNELLDNENLHQAENLLKAKESWIGRTKRLVEEWNSIKANAYSEEKETYARNIHNHNTDEGGEDSLNIINSVLAEINKRLKNSEVALKNKLDNLKKEINETGTASDAYKAKRKEVESNPELNGDGPLKNFVLRDDITADQENQRILSAAQALVEAKAKSNTVEGLDTQARLVVQQATEVVAYKAKLTEYASGIALRFENAKAAKVAEKEARKKLIDDAITSVEDLIKDHSFSLNCGGEKISLCPGKKVSKGARDVFNAIETYKTKKQNVNELHDSIVKAIGNKTQPTRSRWLRFFGGREESTATLYNDILTKMAPLKPTEKTENNISPKLQS